ncbi:MAG: T9SS type A sorting domain-containing protein, partial [Candidatus Marinimicrobia bacterium]|nr:T9SS type A sorting domain-containing protein [Candidatus Neomarinimicrobiota bacterium]
SDGATSKDGTLTITFTASEATTNFVVEDITVSGGALSSFSATSSTVYTATFTPSASGATTIDVAANKFTDAVGNNNTAATQFNWTYDGTAPVMTITATNGTSAVTDGSSTIDNYLVLTFTSSEPTSNFIVDDITAVGGNIHEFTAVSSTVYTATFSPQSSGAKTIDVEVNKFTDTAGNNNTAATQFNWTRKSSIVVKKVGSGDYSTIAAAISGALSGDTITVYDGTYSENLSITDKNLVIVSDNGAGNTIIYGGDNGKVIKIEGSSSVSLDGFKLQDGFTTSGGGGIYISSTGSINLNNLIIENNVAATYGGGIYIAASADVTINACKIYSNEAVEYGGGIANRSDKTIIKNSLIYDNKTSGYDGGGIDATKTFTLINSTLVGNSVPNGRYGAAIRIATTLDSVLIFNSVFNANYGGENYSADDGIYINNGKLIAYNNYFNAEEANGELTIERGSGNIFSNMDPFTSSSSDDYTIKSADLLESGISSIIMDGITYNAPTADISGNSRPNPTNTAPDMGAYESSSRADITPPAMPTEVVATSGDTKISFTWKGNVESDLSGYKVYRSTATNFIPSSSNLIATVISSIDPVSWSDNNLINSTTYYYRISAIDNAGNESDKTAEISAMPEGIKSTAIFDGNPVDSNELDYTNSSTTLSAYWNTFIYTEDLTYYYAVGNSSINNLIDWTSAGTDTSFTLSNLSLENDVTYYISVYAASSESNLSDTISTDGITVDTQIPIITDIIETDSEYGALRDWYGAGDSTTLIVTATDNNSITNYNLSISKTAFTDDVIAWFNSDTNMVTIDLSSLNENIQYYSNAKVTDIAGNISDIKSSAGFKMDYTNPVAGQVSSGEPYQANTTSINLNWSGFSDAQSGINHYEYSLGKQPNSGDLITRVNVGLSEYVTINDLDLENNETYYSTIYAVDNVENEISASSAGVTIDNVGPTIGVVADGLVEDTDLLNSLTDVSMNWSGFFDINGIKNYEVSLGTSEGLNDVVGWVNVDANTNHSFSGVNLSTDAQYFTNVIAIDSLGNISEIASSDGFILDVIPPVITSTIQNNTGDIVSFNFIDPNKDWGITFILSENIISGDVEIYSEQGDVVNFNISIIEQNKISLAIQGPRISKDEITLTIANVIDLAGNSMNDTSFTVGVYMLSDFNQNGSIDVSDLSQFVSGWESKDLEYEIGPVTGEAPYFKPALDGVYNGRDGMTFYRMWHSDNSQAGKLIAKNSNEIGSALITSIDNNNLIIIPPVGAKASEIIINYPSTDIRVSTKEIDNFSTTSMALSIDDTLSGRLLNHQIINSGQSINFDIKHFQKNDISINLSYLFINENNETISSGRSDLMLSPVPEEFALHQNYPNPFNPVTTINYDLPQQSYVNMFIYDILGREVANLVGKEISAGYHSIIWNTNNNLGSPVSAGIYFYQIQTRDFVKTKKLVILK